MQDNKLNTEVFFKHSGKIYRGKIINYIGIDKKYKEYKIVSWLGDFWFVGWVKASDIVPDRRSKKDRRNQ